jgi:hypothetical protein
MKIGLVATVFATLCVFPVQRSAFADDLVAAVLPLSRSPAVGQAATAFATVINTSGRNLTGCSVTLSGFPGTFVYRTTNPATNAVNGAPNQSFSLAVGASQSLFVSLQPVAAQSAKDEPLVFQCTGSTPAPSVIGVNTLLLSVGASATPDIIALVATPSGDGVVRMAGTGQAQAFALATVNVGSGGPVTVSADTGDIALPLQVSICQTNSTTGACLSPPASTVSTTINQNGVPTFSVFTTAQASLPFFPSTVRLNLRFRDSGGAVRGSTSVALSTAPTLAAGQTAGGYYLGVYRITSGPLIGQSGKAALLIAEDGETRGVSYDPFSPSTISSLFSTQSVPTSSLSYFSSGSIFAATGYQLVGGVSPAPLTLSGTVSPRSFVAGVFQLTGEAGQFYASYQSGIYERPSSLSSVSGAWTLRDLNGNAAGSLQVSANGSFSGSDGFGCQYNGNLKIIDANYNAYRINLTVSNCGQNSGVYNGLGGLFDGRSHNDSFQFDLSSPSFIETNYITRY